MTRAMLRRGRSFALQLSLAAVPLVIADAGLATSLGADKVAEVVAHTVVAVSRC
jgi:hypothetical protein